MKVSIDTKEDSHEEIRKVIKMLQNLVGESQEVFTNDSSISSAAQASQEASNPFANIFGDSSAGQTGQDAQAAQSGGADASSLSSAATESEARPSQDAKPEDESESSEDLFAELFSEEELKKMDIKKEEEKEDEVELKPKGKKYDIELY